MGGTTKLRFPLPHRRQKHQQTQQPVHEVQMISAPMTSKAQKFLGTAEINIDATSSPTSPLDAARPWETRSTVSAVSGISVTVTESSAPGQGSEVGTVRGGRGAARGSNIDTQGAWDQESDIIPKDLGLGSTLAGRGRNLDTTTDASSLRRRRSSSTIVSYYDKTKLPLSISQQTSNSAMAKGPPSKILDTLSMEVPRPAPAPPTQSKKKPTRLDLAQLLPHGTTSRLAKFAQKGGIVRGPDALTRPPSVLTSPPVASPLAYDHKAEKKLRKKLTKESLKSLQTSRTDSFPSFSPDPTIERLRSRASEAGTLHQLYEHYEQTSWRDTLPPDEPLPTESRQPSGTEAEVESRGVSRRSSRQSMNAISSSSSPLVSKPRHHLSPSASAPGWSQFSTYPSDADCGPIPENPRISVTSSTLASRSGDYATSVSSRHTRTSKASKRTESFADFDYNATSVLSLSSDSEDDYPDPPKTATSVPSTGSRDSMFSASDYRRPSNSSISQDSVRTQPKSRYRNSLTPQNPFHAIPEHAQSTPLAQPTTTTPRSSSLVPLYATNNSPRPSVSTTSSSAHSASRHSQGSASTVDSSPAHFSRPRPHQNPEMRHVAMLQSQDPAPAQQSFEPGNNNLYSTKKRDSQPMSPLSPSSMEFVIRDRSDPNNDHDGPILTLSGADSASEERFMAVTKQEEMLLAAMRAKRALMRESSQLVDPHRSGHKAAGKKESVSSIRTVKANNTLQPPPLQVRAGNDRTKGAKVPPELRFPPSHKQKSVVVVSKDKADDVGGQEQVLLYLDRTMSTMSPYDMAEPSPDLSDFVIDFDAEQFPAPPNTAGDGRGHSRTSSTASAAGRLTHKLSKHSDGHPGRDHPRPDSEFMPAQDVTFSYESAPPLPQEAEYADFDAIPQHLSPGPPANRRMQDLIEDAFRPRSPSDTIREGEESSHDPPMSPPSRKKAVRISAVGLQLPEIGQWGDDG